MIFTYLRFTVHGARKTPINHLAALPAKGFHLRIGKNASDVNHLNRFSRGMREDGHAEKGLWKD
jgi:hypothetical protein